jgi:hypothetical protein
VSRTKIKRVGGVRRLGLRPKENPMSRPKKKNRIRPSGVKKHRARPLLQAVDDDAPTAGLQRAAIRLSEATSPTEKTQRLQAVFQLIGAFEESLFEETRRLACAEATLVAVTGGEFFSFQFGGTLPNGTKIRVVDGAGVECVMVDVQRGRFIRLPEMVDPLAVELVTPDGKSHRIVPGQPVVIPKGSEIPAEEADDDAPAPIELVK